MVDWVDLVLPLWLMVPALVPNSAAVLTGGGLPMDLGRTWRGQRVLGDGKTWRGFFGGAFVGMAVGLVQVAIAAGVGSTDHGGFGQWPDLLGPLALLAFGALLGDAAGSFVKRRLRIKRGAKAPVLDQYNFVVGALVMLAIFDWSWLVEHFWEGQRYLGALVFLALVPILHRGVNVLGFRWGKKEVPW